jgi:hypothetical protein
LLVTDNLSLLKAQRIATLGDWIQSIGGAVEGVRGEKSIQHFISEELIP